MSRLPLTLVFFAAATLPAASASPKGETKVQARSAFVTQADAGDAARLDAVKPVPAALAAQALPATERRVRIVLPSPYGR